MDIKDRLKQAIGIEDRDEDDLNEHLERDRLCNFVRDKIEQVRENSSRITHEGVWLTNTAYTLGFDSVFYDVNQRQFRPIQFAGQFLRKHKISVNRILPSLQNRASRLTKNPPRYDVRPKSMEEDDKEAARLSLHVINQVWDQQQINRKRLEMIMWMQQCGFAFLKVCWDKTLGPKVRMINDEGELVEKPAGDIRVDVVNAFEIFPDPIAKSHDELNWIVHAKIRPLHYFCDHYGEMGEEVKPEDVWLTSLQYEYRINSFNNQSGASSGTTNLIKDSAIELSYYEKPTSKHPQGRHIVCANGVLLKNDELPIDEIPFAKFDDIIVAGKYYAESTVTHARPIQDQYNRTIAQRASWVNKLLTGKILAPRGADLINNALNDESGEVIEYNPTAGPPMPMQMPNIPQYAYNEDDMLIGMMDNIFGLSEPSQGQMPSAGIPAIGMQFLVEQDMTRIGVITEQHEYAYAAVGRMILKFVERYYNDERILKIAGKNMQYTVKSFIGQDIKGNHDVMVLRGSTLPGSKVLKRQEILNLHQGGYLGDPADPETIQKVMEMLEYGEIQNVWKKQSLDEGQFEKHLSMIENGQEPPISEFDNHPYFIKRYNEYRISDKFGKLGEYEQMLLLKAMNIHVDEIIKLKNPELMTPDPSLAPQDVAQENFEELSQQVGANPDTGEIPLPNIEISPEDLMEDEMDADVTAGLEAEEPQ